MKRIKIIILALLITTCLSAQEKDGSVYMVANAHFDSQWEWDVQKSISVYVRNTLTQNLWLFEQYPNYVFNFEGGVKYSWMKEYFPEHYEKIKKYIREGRWHISGSSWDANDANIPSPESFTRNILLGQQFYKDEFGVKSTDIFLPDCFGFGYTLPTVAAHCGLIGFSSHKLHWRTNPFYGDQKFPFSIGFWKGIDQSMLVAALDVLSYTKKYQGEDISLDNELIALVEKSPNKKAYRYYGTGDIGGSTTILSVEAVEKGVKGDGPIHVISATSDQLFKEYLPFEKHTELPVFDGELLLDVCETGCYTSQAAMKLYNRRNEQLADAAERASVMAEWLGGLAYPSEKITHAWRQFVWHQFHDDLTGTSIPKAYTFSWNDELISQTAFNDILIAASGQVSRAMNTQVQGIPVIVYNPLSQSRKDIVRASIPIATEPKGVEVYAPNGSKVNAQLLSYNKGKAEVVFAAKVAPTGYAVYDLRPVQKSNAQSSTLKIGERTLENAVYKVTLDNNGDISSIKDKRTGKELVEKGKSIRLALFTNNESFDWPSWEILKKTIDAPAVSITGNVKISVAEQGEARIALRVERTCDESKFVQVISLTNGAADDRIDIENEIDWRQSNALLKVEFPLNISNPQATYDLGIGAIRRGNNTPIAYEVYAQQWADLSEPNNSYGVSIINNSRYGWDKPSDNTIRLTLLHTPKTDRKYVYQGKQDLGYHTFAYSIIGHKGSYIDGETVRKADAMNNPLYAFVGEKHKGDLGKEFSMVKSNSKQIDIKTFKKAEASDMYVVRVYETEGKAAGNVELEFNAPVVWAKELNGIEEEIGDVKISGNKLIFSTTSFRPKTFGVKLAQSRHQVTPFKNTRLDLKFNGQAFSTDVFLQYANFDFKGNTYSYDILPKILNSEGVAFKFGEMKQNNVLKCNGDTITFAADSRHKTLYLLAASTNDDIMAEFDVNGTRHTFEIPYYSGFYGQWGGFEQDFKGYIRKASLAYAGTHRHSQDEGNQAYVFTYMYKIAIPLTAENNRIILPRNRNLAIFAATLSEGKEVVTPAAEFRRLSMK